MRKVEPIGPEIPTAPYPLFLSGNVSKGFGRGSKELGIPTGTLSHLTIANLPESVATYAGDKLKTGIYYGWASVGSNPSVWPAVMSFGWNPYYKNEKRSAEVHIINIFESDFYGEELRFIVVGYLRDEQNYPSLGIAAEILTNIDALIKDINLDKEIALVSLDREHYKILRTTAFIKASIPNVNSGPGQRGEALKLLTKGNDLWNSSKPNDAIEAYKTSLSIHQSSDAYYNLGNCYYSIGKIDDAKDCWESSLKFDSTRSDAHVNLGNIYALNLKDFKNANSHYEAALSINDSDGEVHYNYAAILDAQGNLEKCITHYQKARKLGMTIADKNLRNAMARLIANQSKKNQ